MKAESPGLAPAYGGWYAPVDVEIGPSPQALLCSLHLCTPNDDEHDALCAGWTTEERLRWTLKVARAARPAKESSTCMPCGD